MMQLFTLCLLLICWLSLDVSIFQVTQQITLMLPKYNTKNSDFYWRKKTWFTLNDVFLCWVWEVIFIKSDLFFRCRMILKTPKLSAIVICQYWIDLVQWNVPSYTETRFHPLQNHGWFHWHLHQLCLVNEFL